LAFYLQWLGVPIAAGILQPILGILEPNDYRRSRQL
jgi:hypothetical protein